jgi:hypothetical protein
MIVLDFHQQKIRIISLAKMKFIPRLICRFKKFLIKISAGFFAETGKLILKFVGEMQGTLGYSI